MARERDIKKGHQGQNSKMHHHFNFSGVIALLLIEIILCFYLCLSAISIQTPAHFTMASHRLIGKFLLVDTGLCTGKDGKGD